MSVTRRLKLYVHSPDFDTCDALELHGHRYCSTLREIGAIRAYAQGTGI